MTRCVRAFALLLGTFLILNTSTPASAMNIEEVTSPGGIKAWLVQQNSVPLLSLKFSFDGGSAQDPDGKEGVANFLTAMLDEGAGDMNAQAFQEEVENLAMRMSFEEGRDQFFGDFSTLTKNRDASIALLKLALNKPRFDTDAIERMRKQLLASLVYAQRSADKVASKEWYKAAFGGHVYGRPSSGTEASVKSITRDDLESYRARVFAKDKLHVVAVGDINAEQLGKLLDDVFGDLAAKSDLKAVAEVLPAKGIQKVVEMDVPQSVAVFGGKGVARKDPDFMSAFVLNHILGGGGFSSKLMEEVREKRGLAYSVYSYLAPLDHAAIFSGGVATKNSSIKESLEVIRAELGKMADTGPTAEDLANAKQYLTGSYALRFDTSGKTATQLLGILVEEMGIDYVDKRNALIEAVTLDDVKRVAKTLLDADDLIVLIVGKPDGMKSSG